MVEIIPSYMFQDGVPHLKSMGTSESLRMVTTP